MDNNIRENNICYIIDGQQKYVKIGVIDFVCRNDITGRYDIWVYYIAPKETRTVTTENVKDVPIDLFETEQVWHKLPKGWTYNTKLYKVNWNTNDELKNVLVSDRKKIQELYDAGELVKEDSLYGGEVGVDIDHGKYRVYKRYPAWTEHYGKKAPYEVCRKEDIFFKYTDAQNKLNEIKKQIAYEESMTDTEWSIREIERTLKLFNKKDADHYRKIVMQMPDLDELEVRKRYGQLEYKYFRQGKEWKLVDPEEREDMERLDGNYNRGYTKALLDMQKLIKDLGSDVFFRSKFKYRNALESVYEFLLSDSYVRDCFRSTGGLDMEKFNLCFDAKTGKLRKRDDGRNIEDAE